MRDFSARDTIVAVATPPGHGGIGVVRLSGPDAQTIAHVLAPACPLAPRHAAFTRLLDPDRPTRSTLDQVVITLFASPHSYTGDDVVEISAHGSPVLLRRIVELAMRAGARLAEPGEFTLRAYLNGRIDLVQAEAVADLVDAVTPLQARAAMDQLEGTLTAAISRVDAMVFDLAARLEASLDFPDEGFHFITREQAMAELAAAGAVLDALCREGAAGRLIREGRTVVIAGQPNAGKSSLFNALVGAHRAIVTEVPGTTRDLVTERVDLNGVLVTLVDTAGLHETHDAIEAEGVRRAREAQAVAALRLVLVDGSVPLAGAARALVHDTASPRLVIVTKADLPRAWPIDDALRDVAGDAVAVSAVTGAGLDELRGRIVTTLAGGEPLHDVPAISNLRHLALVNAAREAVAQVAAELERGATEELALAELGAARRALESITGRRSPEELLEHIFSRFCVGK